MRSGFPQVAIALALLLATLGSVVVSTDRPETAPTTAVPSEERSYSWWKGPGGVDPVDRKVRVVADLREDAAVPPQVNTDGGAVYTREGTRHVRGFISLTEVRALSDAPGVLSVRIAADADDPTVEDEREGRPSVDDIVYRPEGPVRVSRGVIDVGAAVVHADGTTGDGVTVGVVDGGFRPSHPAVADQVTAYRSFGTTEGSRHGTAVAAVVADTAPGADLHLAAIGSTTTPEEYRAAMEWLEASGVDVVVDAGSYFGDTRDRRVAAVAAETAGSTTVVTSAGNYARRHWTGVSTVEDGWVGFEGGDRRNTLAEGASISGRVSLDLRWEGDAEYELALVRDLPAGDLTVARADDGPTDDGRARLSTVVPGGRYYVTVRTEEGSPTGRVDLFASHDLEHATPAGSLTVPATAEGVIAVGAVQGDTAAPFSSQGPTIDGRRGVDLLAPDAVAGFEDLDGGTSFAAPYVAGTVALTHQAAAEAPVGDPARVVVETADDIGPAGPDAATGYGILNATAAVASVERHRFPVPVRAPASSGAGTRVVGVVPGSAGDRSPSAERYDPFADAGDVDGHERNASTTPDAEPEPLRPLEGIFGG
jgi:subtilisin family serine protease